MGNLDSPRFCIQCNPKQCLSLIVHILRVLFTSALVWLFVAIWSYFCCFLSSTITLWEWSFFYKTLSMIVMDIWLVFFRHIFATSILELCDRHSRVVRRSRGSEININLQQDLSPLTFQSRNLSILSESFFLFFFLFLDGDGGG